MVNVLIVVNTLSPGTNGNTGKIAITATAIDDAIFKQVGYDVFVNGSDSNEVINQALIDAAIYQLTQFEAPIDETTVYRIFGALV